MSYENNISKIRETDFLNLEVENNNFVLAKCGKSIFNFKKDQLKEFSHGSTVDFFINPKNSYNANPFGVGQFFIDFELPKIEYTIYKFILSFSLFIASPNTGNGYLMPIPLILDRISLLKNSNTVGNDIHDYDILLYNLNKYFNILMNGDTVNQLGVNYSQNIGSAEYLGSNLLYNTSIPVNIELPISLSDSGFPLNKIKNDLTIRVFFKSKIGEQAANDLTIGLSSVQMILRVNEMTQKYKSLLYKQPKINHCFNKRVFTRVNINQLTTNQNYNVIIPGFRGIASAVLIYLSTSESVIDTTTLGGNTLWHIFKYGLDQVYINDSSGRNILNGNKLSLNYSRFLFSNHFKNLTIPVNLNTQSLANNGELFYIPFCNEDSDSFNGCFSGGYNFNGNGDYSLNFVSKSTCSNVILNMMWFCPSLLTLMDGDIEEILA